MGCELAGDPSILITGVSTLEKAAPGEVTFLANMKYAPKVKQTRAAAVFASEPLKDTSAATLISSNPYYDFARALALSISLLVRRRVFTRRPSLLVQRRSAECIRRRIRGYRRKRNNRPKTRSFTPMLLSTTAAPLGAISPLIRTSRFENSASLGTA